jgi:hypothetical protein
MKRPCWHFFASTCGSGCGGKSDDGRASDDEPYSLGRMRCGGLSAHPWYPSRDNLAERTSNGL